MTTTTATVPGLPRSRSGAGRAFVAILRRDIYVTGKELPVFAAQVILQPLFMLFVFGKILTNLGYAQHGFVELLFPGVVAFTAVLTALQSTSFPLVLDFSFTKEIEDRLLAPIPVWLVAVEKMIFASLRAIIAGIVMFPIGVAVLGSIPWRVSGLPLLIAVMVLGSLMGSALGMCLGTLVPPERINILFAVILTPLLFTGCTQYPWPSLSHLRWFQWVTAGNPLTYASEGMRAALVPSVPHIRPWVCLLMLVGWLGVLSMIGIRGFLRRAIG
ncbi:MAG: ABC transporter permease [Mycobacteriales bacterium]